MRCSFTERGGEATITVVRLEPIWQSRLIVRALYARAVHLSCMMPVHAMLRGNNLHPRLARTLQSSL
eukprot:5604245-Alexandrium_andersonii.AAC.1